MYEDNNNKIKLKILLYTINITLTFYFCIHYIGVCRYRQKMTSRKSSFQYICHFIIYKRTTSFFHQPVKLICENKHRNYDTLLLASQLKQKEIVLSSRNYKTKILNYLFYLHTFIIIISVVSNILFCLYLHFLHVCNLFSCYCAVVQVELCGLGSYIKTGTYKTEEKSVLGPGPTKPAKVGLRTEKTSVPKKGSFLNCFLKRNSFRKFIKGLFKTKWLD